MSERPDEVIERVAAWKHRPRSTDPATEMSAQAIYSDLMKSAFAPALRDLGLRGSGGRFELPSNTHWLQLGFQKSSYSDRQELRYTVNLSAIRRDEWQTQIEAKPFLGQKPKPSTHYGRWALQARIGQLTKEGADKWWRIFGGMNSDAVRDDTLADLVSLAVPWLRQQSSP